MTISRISDSNTLDFLRDRAVRNQLEVRRLQEQLVSGRRLLTPDQEPLSAARILRHDAALSALAQYEDTSRFGVDVLHAQDEALEESTNLLIRAEELASQHASGLYTPAQRAAAAEEVHGILQALTSLGNSTLGGRRLFSGLALDSANPFADPDAPGYTAATAYTGSTHEFEVRIGDGSDDRVRVSTQGDQVFGAGLVALEQLRDTLTANGNVGGTLTALSAARDGVASERASVGARQSQLAGRIDQVRGHSAQEATARGELRDTDVTVVATQLAQAQNALQALIAVASQIRETSLASILRL